MPEIFDVTVTIANTSSEEDHIPFVVQLEFVIVCADPSPFETQEEIEIGECSLRLVSQRKLRNKKGRMVIHLKLEKRLKLVMLTEVGKELKLEIVKRQLLFDVSVESLDCKCSLRLSFLVWVSQRTLRQRKRRMVIH
ncbi:uncharacterized protein [Malus domestica]|uniref:uncharacterized protein n=1 Tax=Malus domestica TaxID=3750 RepID=UPI000498B06B